VAIDREHLRFTPEGLTIHIPRSKRDQEGEGTTAGIPRGLNPLTCPVRAVETWLKRSRVAYGVVFQRLSVGGALEGRLGPKGVWKILRKRAEQAGLTVDESERLSPHGLRAGFITEAYLEGALDEQVMHHTRQKGIATTQSYRRRAKITRGSPARLLDLSGYRPPCPQHPRPMPRPPPGPAPSDRLSPPTGCATPCRWRRRRTGSRRSAWWGARILARRPREAAALNHQRALASMATVAQQLRADRSKEA
jgi:hypothetical protein